MAGCVMACLRHRFCGFFMEGFVGLSSNGRGVSEQRRRLAALRGSASHTAMMLAAATLLATAASAQVNAGQTVKASDLTGTSTTLNGGTVQLDNTTSKDYSRDWTLNAVTSGANTIDINGTTSNLSGKITGSGNIVFSNSSSTASKLTISNSSNDYTGTTTIGSGVTLALVDSDLNSDSNSTSGTIEHSQRLINNGTFDISGAVSGRTLISLSGSGNIVLGSNTLTLYDYDSVAAKTYDTNTTFGGVISGTGGLVLTSGEITLAGVNTYTSSTTVSSGTLHLSGTGSIASSSVVVVYGTLDASAVSTGSVSFNSLSGTGTLTLGSNNLVLTNASGYFSGTITGASTLYLNGGIQWLGGTSQFTKAVIAAGTLQAGSATVTYDVENSGTFTLASNDPIAMSGIVSGSGELTKIGTGIATLTKAQTYTGATTISAGTLKLSGDGNIAYSSGVENDATFDIADATGTVSITTLSGSGTVRLGANTLTISNGNSTGLFSGVINGTGGLTVTGGNQVFSGANTYIGDTHVQGGALSLVVGGSLRSAVTVDSGATLHVVPNITSTGSASVLSLGGAGAVDLGANTLTVTNAAQTFSGKISGTGNLYISSGTMVLSGDNSYTGTTTVSSGTLKLDGGRLAAASKMVVNGTLDATNAGDATLTFAALSGTASGGKVLLGGHGLEIDTVLGTSAAFAGVISGTGGLTVGGSGTQILAGANTYSGGTTIASGATLQIGNGGTTGSVAGDIANNGTLKFYRQDSSNVVANNISGSGGIVQSGVGTTKLTGTNTYTGTTTITNGTLQIGDGGTTGSIDKTSGIINNSNLAFARSDAVTIDAPISGIGNVAVLSGRVTFAQANSYTGVTTIASGAALALTDTASITSSSSVSIDGTLDLAGLTTGTSLKSLAGGDTGNVVLGNSTLTLTAASTTFAGAITGTGNLVLTGGTQILSGNSASFTGLTSVNGGTLNVTGSLAGSSVTVATGGTVTGSGTIGNLTTTGTGTVRGKVGSTLTTGNIALASGSNFTVAMTATHSANALVSTAGSASVGGAVVSIASTDGTFDLGNQIKILSAGTLTGDFTLAAGSTATTATFVGNTVGGNNAAVFRSTLSKTGNDYYLTVALDQLTPALTATGKATTNQMHVAAGIDAAIKAGKTPSTAIQSLGNDTTQALLADTTQLSGELGANTPLVANALFNPFIDVMESRTGLDRPIPKGGMPLQAWVAGYGATDLTNGNAGEGSSKFRSSSQGVVFGAQWTPYANMLIGGAISAGTADFHVANGLGDGTATSLAGGIYGYIQMSRHFYNSFAAAVSGTQIKTTRIATANGTDTLSSKFTAFSFGGRYEAGIQLPWFTPYAALQDHLSMMPGYTETAPAGHDAFALQYDSRTYNSGRVELGIRHQVDVSVTPRWILTPDFTLHLIDRLAYAYDLSDGSQAGAMFAALPSSDFTVFGAKAGRQSALASVGAEVNFDGGLHVSTRLDTAFTKRSQAFTGSFTVGYTW